MQRLLPALIALLVLSGCGGDGKEEAAIRGVMTQYTDAWSNRDAKTLCTLVTPDTSAAFKRLGGSCDAYLTKRLVATSDKELADARRVRINAIRVRDDDDAIVEFTGGNGVTKVKKLSGRWLIEGTTR